MTVARALGSVDDSLGELAGWRTGWVWYSWQHSLTKCPESPPTGRLVQLVVTVKQCKQHWAQRTGPGVGQWEEQGTAS